MKFRFTYIIYIFGIWLSFRTVYGKEEQSQPLVPLIEQKNFELRPSEKGYTLLIELLNGSTRADNLELRKPKTPEEEDELYMTGQTLNIHPEGVSITTYEAGKNGYFASYKYTVKGVLTNRISGVALKTAAG